MQSYPDLMNLHRNSRMISFLLTAFCSTYFHNFQMFTGGLEVVIKWSLRSEPPAAAAGCDPIF